MKRILFSIFIVLGLCGLCDAQDGFRIMGQLGGSFSETLYLFSYGSNGLVKLGETLMMDGSFEFSGNVTTPNVAYVMTGKKQLLATIMLENADYMLTVGTDGIDVTGGGESQKVWEQFNAINKRIGKETMRANKEYQAAYMQKNNARAIVAHDQLKQAERQALADQRELLKIHGNTYVGAYVVYSKIEVLAFEQLSDWYGLLSEEAKATFFGNAVKTILDRDEKTAIGAIAPDFTASLADGGTLSLHETKAKVKLVDFWASWCGPCRQENKNLPKLYQKYHKKGLEIISISLDNNEQDWKQAIKVDKMIWKNVSDLKLWKSALAKLYNVTAIPHTILLDENNRIVAKNLRGGALQKKIAEMLDAK